MFRKLLTKATIAIGLLVSLFTVDAVAQGGLSNQVLQLLSRTNAWIGTNTYSDLRVANAAIPSVTTYRIYADQAGNLYFNGGLIAGAGGGVTPHNLLSSTHADTAASTVLRGSLIVGNSTPAWAQLTIGANHSVLVSNGTDAAWGTDGSGLINLNAAQLTGTIAAISGANLTSLNATQLTLGTVPLARISGLTNTQLSGTAGITYANLTLTNGIVNADINSAAAIAYSKLNLATSILNTDIANTQITFAKWASNACSNLQVPQSNGSTWSCHSIVGSDIASGVVTSVSQTVPTGFTISGSPVTSSGTLAIGLSNESANTVWAGPTSGGAVAPAFRALVNGDFPTSGATAGTYPLVTVNAQGIVTAGSAALASGTILVSTPWTFTQTWNAGGVTFTGVLVNMTSTASAAASLLEDWQLGGVSKFKIDKSGNITGVGNATMTGGYAAFGSTPSTTVGLLSTLASGDQILTSTQGAGEVSGVNLIDLAATWNNAANTPTAFKLNITDTASNAASLLMNLLKSGVSQFSVSKSGVVTAVGLANLNGGWTIPTATTATVTDTDALTIGGNKIPNTEVYHCEGLDVNSLSGDCIFIVDRAIQVTQIKMQQAAQGAGGCVLDVEKLTGTTAPGAGTVLGTASYNCNATANNTVTTYTLTGTTATLQFAAGDRIGIKLGGSLTGLRGLTAMVQVKAI